MSTDSSRPVAGESASLTAAVQADADAIRVRLTGELDLATAEQLPDLVRRLDGNGSHDVVLDLSDLTFCDACGLRALLRAHRAVRAGGGRLTLIGVPPLTRHLLAVTGLSEAFDLS
ncbi:MAG: STAS domain-containing protein [Actinomycetes bacterium]